MTFLLCDPGWYVHKPDVQNRWADNTHTHTHMYYILYTRCPTSPESTIRSGAGLNRRNIKSATRFFHFPRLEATPKKLATIKVGAFASLLSQEPNDSEKKKETVDTLHD